MLLAGCLVFPSFFGPLPVFLRFLKCEYFLCLYTGKFCSEHQNVANFATSIKTPASLPFFLNSAKLKNAAKLKPLQIYSYICPIFSVGVPTFILVFFNILNPTVLQVPDNDFIGSNVF